MTLDVKDKIMKILQEKGIIYPNAIVKELGISLGAVQWYMGVLEREGYVERLRIGRRTYYRARDGSHSWDVYVEDLIEEVRQRLRGAEKMRISELSGKKADFAKKLFALLRE